MASIERLNKAKMSFNQRYAIAKMKQDKLASKSLTDVKGEPSYCETLKKTDSNPNDQQDEATQRHSSHEIDLIEADLDYVDDDEEDSNENYGDLEDDDDDVEDDDDDTHLYTSSQRASDKKTEKRRHSYKENDRLRKQRLKNNLNQLLIEYKHEEEAQLRKSTQCLSVLAPPPQCAIGTHRGSLDSTNPLRTTFNTLSTTMLKGSMQQPSHDTKSISTIDLTKQNYINSAFKPINKILSAAMSASVTGSSSSTAFADGTKPTKGTNDNSYSSSSCSSWSSSTSSSNSPPKLRVFNSSKPKSPTLNEIAVQTNSQPIDKENNSLLNSPSYASTTSSSHSNKSLTIVLRNNPTNGDNKPETTVEDTYVRYFLYFSRARHPI